MRITNIIMAVLMAFVVWTFYNFMFYPYSELASMQAKLEHARECLYMLGTLVVALFITALVASRN